jgi:hypothetical protein
MKKASSRTTGAKSRSGRKPPPVTLPPSLPASSSPATPGRRKARPDDHKMEMERKLLAIGGTEVVWPDEHNHHLWLLLVHGRGFDEKVLLRRGEREQPHTNAARLWAQSFDQHRIATGYALGEDGRWLRHCWVVQQEKPDLGACLLETTHRRAAYFGYTLAQFEAIFFWTHHFLWAYGEAPLKEFYGIGTPEDLANVLGLGWSGRRGGAQSGAARGARKQPG